MKPGDEGGSLPSIDLFFLRRMKRQHANSIAAIAISASGTPIPIPSFSRLDKPESAGTGASGSADAVEYGDRVLVDCPEAEESVANVVEDAAEDADDKVKEDAELEVSLKRLLDDAVGAEIASDSGCVDDSEADVSVFEACDTLVSEGRCVADAVTSVGMASLTGGAAVAGPNSCIK
jgi:hypothetical protein